MSTSWQKVEVGLTGGLYEKAQPEQAPFGSFQQLYNLRHNRDGALVKHPGHSTLSTTLFGGGNLTSGFKLMARKDAPLISDGTTLFSYSNDPMLAHWRPIGLVPPCAVNRRPIVGLQVRHSFADFAYANGFYVVVWSAPDNAGGPAHLFARVIDSVGGEVSIPDTLLTQSGGTQNDPIFKVCVVGNFVFVIWGFVGGSELRWIKLDTGNITAGWGLDHQLTNTTNIGGNCTFDVFGGTSQFYVAYVISHAAANDQIDIRAYDSSVTQQSAKTSYQPFGAGIAIGAIGVGGNQSDIIWVGSALADAAVIGLSPSNVATVTSAQGTVMNAVNGALLGVLWTGTKAGHLLVSGGHATTQSFWRKFADSAGTVGTSGTATQSKFRICPISRQFLAPNGRVYAHMMEVTTTAGLSSQNMACLLDLTDTSSSALTSQVPFLAACPAPRLAVLPYGVWFPGSSTNQQGLSHVAQLGSTFSIAMGVLKSTATGIGSGAASSLDLCTYDFASPLRAMNAQIGEAFVMGPQPYTYDGANLYEVGFFTSPAQPTVAAAGGAPTLAAGNYIFIALYEDVNSAGCVDWSTPSVPTANYNSLGGAGSAAVVTVQTLQITARHGSGQTFTRVGTRPRIVLYASFNGGAFQRVTGSETANDPTADTVNITVTAIDPAAPVLYTTPGAAPGTAPLARQIPAPLNVIINHADRFVGIDESGKSVWFSGQYIYGEQAWFSSAFQFPIDQGRPLTALGSTDGRLWIFKRDRIFYVDGDGPTDTGAGFYGLPQEIPCGGSGCIEPRSVVTTGTGTMYLADQGIYQVSRGASVEFIGRGVEQSTLFGQPGISSALVHQSLGKVLFTTYDQNNTGVRAVRLVWDTIHQTWSIDVVGSNVPFVSAAMIGGTLGGSENWYGLTSSGTVYTERLSSDPSAFLDGSSWQTSIMQTGWIPFDDPFSKTSGNRMGFQRVRFIQLLLQEITGHDLTISLAYDYNPNIVDTVTFTAAQIANFIANGFPEQIGIECSRQKVEAIQITVQDAQPSSGSIGTGQGAIWLGLALQLKSKGGAYRLPPTAKQ